MKRTRPVHASLIFLLLSFAVWQGCVVDSYEAPPAKACADVSECQESACIETSCDNGLCVYAEAPRNVFDDGNECTYDFCEGSTPKNVNRLGACNNSFQEVCVDGSCKPEEACIVTADCEQDECVEKECDGTLCQPMIRTGQPCGNGGHCDELGACVQCLEDKDCGEGDAKCDLYLHVCVTRK